MKLVLGASGRLGSALCREIATRQSPIAPDREVFADWWRPDAATAIAHYLEDQPASIDTIFVAVGTIDPSVCSEEHTRVNYLLPKQVIRTAAPRGIRVVTFGTMMETMLKIVPPGGYAASKVALADFVAQQTKEHNNALHLRINTLYGGGPPAPFMFTGQMLAALRKREQFLMSPGTQRREYHHVDDEAPAVLTMAESGASGVFDLNHGDAVSLAELAERTFQLLGASDLLKVGALPPASNEKPGLQFNRTPQLAHLAFRDVRTAMAEYIRSHLPAGRAAS